MGLNEEVARPGGSTASVEVATVALHEETFESPPDVAVHLEKLLRGVSGAEVGTWGEQHEAYVWSRFRTQMHHRRERLDRQQ